jgi:hypothetical protein
VPGIFVSSQLSRIPGEERKFKRRRIVAFVPICKRERDVAASQTSVGGSPAMGVAVGPGDGVAVGEAIGVGLGSEASVAGGGGGVAVGSKILVSVDGGNGVHVGSERSIVGVIGRAVAVSGSEVGEAGTTVG